MCAAFIPCWFVLIEFELGDCSVSVRTNYIFPPYNSRPHKPKAQFYQAVKFSRGKIDNKFLRWRRGMILSNQKMMASLLQPLFSELKRCVSSIWASFSSSPSRPWSVKSGGRKGKAKVTRHPKNVNLLFWHVVSLWPHKPSIGEFLRARKPYQNISEYTSH